MELLQGIASARFVPVSGPYSCSGPSYQLPLRLPRYSIWTDFLKHFPSGREQTLGLISIFLNGRTVFMRSKNIRVKGAPVRV